MGTRRALALVIGIAILVVLLVVFLAGTIVIAVMRLMDNTVAHRCGLAYVKSSPAAIEMLGTPIEQHGFTGGSSKTAGSAANEDLTFKVAGPLGTATVEAIDHISELDSHLIVRLGRNGTATTIYSDPADCKELHAK